MFFNFFFVVVVAAAALEHKRNVFPSFLLYYNTLNGFAVVSTDAKRIEQNICNILRAK